MENCKMRLLFVFGTRPEAIKMAPIIKEFQKSIDFDTKVAVTGQHRDMLDQVLEYFEIVPDFDLDIMRAGQDLYDVTTNVIMGMRSIFDEYLPDMVFVHGDTTTSLATAIASFYKKIQISHIEAGLRTNNIYSPFPEEMNRVLTTKLATYHFAPTKEARDNLLKDGIDDKNILVTGNTVIDALVMTKSMIENKKFDNIPYHFKNKFILVTGHRRENFGDGFENICNELKKVALEYPDIDIVYPVHLNPNVQKPVKKILSNINNIYLIEPLDYQSFVYMMSNSYIILTDSGGIQEEAPSLGKPVLVMRETTERPEALIAGTIKLVGTDKIYKEVKLLIEDKNEYEKMSKATNPFGDGKSSIRIVKFIKDLSGTI
jgi:UDP-N-acetylglucosamine 2-epimerase (non-hydrolysing)